VAGVGELPPGRLRHGSNLRTFKYKGEPLDALPYIVPPTWNKAIHPQMERLWSKAAEVLSEAENVVVIGFSLPDSDKFFRYLFALGVMSPTKIRRVRVVDKDPNVAPRFQRLMGKVSGASFQPIHVDFTSSFSFLRDVFAD